MFVVEEFKSRGYISVFQTACRSTERCTATLVRMRWVVTWRRVVSEHIVLLFLFFPKINMPYAKGDMLHVYIALSVDDCERERVGVQRQGKLLGANFRCPQKH